MKQISIFTKNNLNKQGFEKLDYETKACYAWPLRFTPGISVVLIVIGLILQSPILLGAMALVALSGVIFPRAIVIDPVYNLGVRHLFRAPLLPVKPTPRRFSYLLSTTFLTGSALSFYFGLSVLGFILGGLVAAGATILATSLWCIESWYYRLFFKHKTN